MICKTKHTTITLIALCVVNCSHILCRASIRGASKELSAFQKAVADGDDSTALELGKAAFFCFEEKLTTDPGFDIYKSKLLRAGHIISQMTGHFYEAMPQQISIAQADAYQEKTKLATSASSAAKILYDASKGLFSRPIRIDSLLPNERTFLRDYYNLQLRTLMRQVVRVGQVISVDEPLFKVIHDVLLVLPLLHTPGDTPVALDTLPVWTDKVDQLKFYSDSCLNQYGLPYQAMTIARRAAQQSGAPFSEAEFYREAAAKCGTQHLHTSAECLRRAYSMVKESDVEARISILFHLVQLWLDSRNYTLAASQARQIYEQYPDHSLSGKAMWLFFYGLCQNESTHEIMADIDKALKDPRCVQYRINLLYIKWWALRRTPGARERAFVVEHELVTNHSDNPIIAPVLLSRATDFLANQDLIGAQHVLAELVEKFPHAPLAWRARVMLSELE